MRKLQLLALALSMALLCIIVSRPGMTEELSTSDVGEVVPWRPVVQAVLASDDDAEETSQVTDVTLLFALHLNVVADVPFEYGVRVYLAAKEFGLHPYDLAATLISEHSGPDSDFSLFSSAGYRHTFKYKPETLGRHAKRGEKERGIFQVKPNWVFTANKKLGTNWKKDDLFDASVNIRVGAFVISENIKSHKDCGDEARKHGLVDTLHSWTAHFKCAAKSRDDLLGRCRVAQRKWDKIRGSLTSVLPVDVKKFGRAHNARVRAVLDSYMSGQRSKLRGKIRNLCEKHGLEIPGDLKKMSYMELKGELQYLRGSVE